MSKVFNIIQPIEFLNHNSEVKKDQMFHSSLNLKWTRQLLLLCHPTGTSNNSDNCDSIKKIYFGFIMEIYENIFLVFSSI